MRINPTPQIVMSQIVMLNLDILDILDIEQKLNRAGLF
jgi:hypothetical protein